MKIALDDRLLASGPAHEHGQIIRLFFYSPDMIVKLLQRI
jgi:hypothetical protein